MGIKTMLLSELEADPSGILNVCAASGEVLVIELPDQRLVVIQALDPTEDDSLTSELLESNPDFQALVEKSKAGPRKPFGAGWS